MFHSNYLCNLFLSVHYHKKHSQHLLNYYYHQIQFIFLYMRTGIQTVFVVAEVKSGVTINKHLNKLVFYLETKGYLKVVAFKQYLKNLLFI